LNTLGGRYSDGIWIVW